jgi:hypothetical protein
MGENDSNTTGIGILVFVVFFVTMLGTFYSVSNLTTSTVFGTIFTGLIIAFLVANGIKES